MKCFSSSSSWLSEGSQIEERRELALGFLGVKRILLKVMMGAMGCVFSCFRMKDSSNSNPHSSLPPDAANETVVTRNRSSLSSLLLSEEHDGTPTKVKEEEQDLGAPKQKFGFDFRVLKDEAKFLKACGTLPETPVEIRLHADEGKCLSSQMGEHERQKFRSWLTNTSIEKFNLEWQPDQPPTPIKVCEEGVKESGSLEHTPSSCMTEKQNTERFSTSSIEGSGIQNATSTKVIASLNDSPTGSSVSTNIMAPSILCKNKSVHFDCEPEMSSDSSKSYSSEIASQNSNQFGSAGNASISKRSPYPTPLKLTDEMQTPGTLFPAYLDGMGQGMNTRIRSQFVYSALNPVENLSRWNVLKDEDSNSNHLSDQTKLSSQQTDVADSLSEAGKGETSDEKELNVDTSLFPSLRLPPSNLDGIGQHNGSTVGDNFHGGRTPGDRPILGMVAAHWNDDEPSRISPKWWDGNGIPNSTNKYKEDQKVNWHATPFEERLEKALSEETFIPQRKQGSRTRLTGFNETEESDTALSQLQSSNHSKSVVSFR